jgi:glycosyltransferase involved in cell wall biosynthesis
LLIGDGRNRPQVEALAQELGIAEKVTFTGHVPYDAVAQHTAAGDITVIPATNDYGNPMKLYDYIALGKAVVAPNQSTVTDIVSHGEGALLFEKGNVGEMSAALTKLVEDSGLRERLGTQARELAKGHTWQRRGQILSRALQAMVRSGTDEGASEATSS